MLEARDLKRVRKVGIQMFVSAFVKIINGIHILTNACAADLTRLK